MKKYIVLAGVLFLWGCSDKPPDNTVTRYGKTLKDSVDKAEDAAEKANEAVRQRQSEWDKAADD